MSGALIPMTLAGWAEHEAAGFAEAFAEVERQIADLDLSLEDTALVLAALHKEMERQHDENMGALAVALGTAH